MSLLPTAHAGQAFGARRIDFYAVSGEVTGSDAGSGRVRDNEGVDHDVRLLERTSALAPGDNATLLRVQSGPNRRSRPVAIINHSRDVWMRASPDATSLLARSGITRSFNWWLSILLLALTAFTAVWPQLHVFFSELFGSAMAGVPAFNIYNEINMLLPSLSGWRLENVLPSGLLDSIAALGVVETAQLTEWGLAAGGLVLSLLAFSARSWRLVYMPILAGFTLAAGTILGGAGATLILIGGAVVLFLLGGLINRIRDAGRFNARIERLAEHALRNPPQEGVRASAPADDALTGAAAATAIASAAAMAHGADEAIAEPAEMPAEATALDATPAEPDADSSNGEAEASAPIELPPVASAEEARAESEDEPETVDAASPDTPVDEASTETVEAEADTAPEGADMVENTEAEAEAEPVAETADEAAAEPADTDAPAAETADAAEDDDDLPSLDAVAAAAALSAAEEGGESPAVSSASEETQTDAEPAELADDRTMAMAPPPPMPSSNAEPAAETPADPEAADTTDSAPAATEEAAPAVEPDVPAEPVTPDAAPEDMAPIASPLQAPPQSEALAGVESRVEEAVTAAATAPEPAMVDDPMMEDDGPDPMMERAHESDLAPGAPELEMEKDPAE